VTTVLPANRVSLPNHAICITILKHEPVTYIRVTFRLILFFPYSLTLRAAESVVIYVFVVTRQQR